MSARRAPTDDPLWIKVLIFSVVLAFLALVLVGFFIWVAENIGTFFGIWRYPDQLGAWVTVSLGKWSSWTVLTLMSFALVSNLKHVKERIHLAP